MQDQKSQCCTANVEEYKDFAGRERYRCSGCRFSCNLIKIPPHQPEAWEMEFDSRFAYITDVCLPSHGATYGYTAVPMLFDELKSFIRSLLASEREKWEEDKCRTSYGSGIHDGAASERSRIAKEVERECAEFPDGGTGPSHELAKRILGIINNPHRI